MASFSLSEGRLGALVALVVAGAVALISTGQVLVPLPAPAHGKFVNPVPADVLPWRPQPLQGDFAPNTRLLDAVRLFKGQVLGAESVAVREDGGLALLDRYGSLWEAPAAPGGGNGSGGGGWALRPEPVARLGAGRPLGYHFDGEGNLVVCDSLKGLVKYDFASRRVELLSSHVSASSPLDPGSEVTYANDLAVAASDGAVYFTSCSDVVPAMGRGGFYDTFRAWTLGLAQGLPKGRLLRYNPKTKETHVLAKGFYYANGVALAKDESYLVLAETDRIRLLKFWLKGPKAGTWEPLLERLPGPPDGVSTAPDGAFWVGLVSPIPPIAALLRDPTVRALYVWLPSWAKPPLKAWGAVAKVSGEDGAVLEWLMDPSGRHVSSVSAAVEHGGNLFLGNLAGDYVSHLDLQASAAAARSATAAAEVAASGSGGGRGGARGWGAAAQPVPGGAQERADEGEGDAEAGEWHGEGIDGRDAPEPGAEVSELAGRGEGRRAGGAQASAGGADAAAAAAATRPWQGRLAGQHAPEPGAEVPEGGAVPSGVQQQGESGDAEAAAVGTMADWHEGLAGQHEPMHEEGKAGTAAVDAAAAPAEERRRVEDREL